MDRYDARKAMVEDLKDLGLLVKVVPHTHAVGTHDRCHTTVEPMIKQQWFVKMEEMAKPAVEAVKRQTEICCRIVLTRLISTGWRTFMTGVFPVGSVRATVSRHVLL